MSEREVKVEDIERPAEEILLEQAEAAQGGLSFQTLAPTPWPDSQYRPGAVERRLPW